MAGNTWPWVWRSHARGLCAASWPYWHLDSLLRLTYWRYASFWRASVVFRQHEAHLQWQRSAIHCGRFLWLSRFVGAVNKHWRLWRSGLCSLHAVYYNDWISRQKCSYIRWRCVGLKDAQAIICCRVLVHCNLFEAAVITARRCAKARYLLSAGVRPSVRPSVTFV